VLEKEGDTVSDRLKRREMQKVLMDELRLMHYPIAVKFFFVEEELREFMDNAPHYEAVKPLTFCQFEIAARMKGQTVLGTKEKLGCSNASFVFGWKPFDEAEVKSHLKFAKSREQAERFVRTKPRLPEGALRAFSVSPLADSYFPPDTVHFYCDNLQAYHLLVDYMAAMDVHPLHSNLTVNSAACGSNVYSYLEKSANLITACGGTYNSGKMERGEVNVTIPSDHLEATVQRLIDRVSVRGSASLIGAGDHFPGADVCKNCPMIVFRKHDKR